MCWECYPCVKACPQNAIEIRGYSDFVPLGAKVLPKRDTAANTITWTIDFRNGKILKFTFPLRSTPWGSIKAPQDLPSGDINSQSLALEDQFLGVEKLPTPKKM
jgi:adenylylsulfate reductase subunit B